MVGLTTETTSSRHQPRRTSWFPVADQSDHVHLVLASGSPRRRELLMQFGVPFSVRIPDIDETPLFDEAPRSYVERLARIKAGHAVAEVGETDSHASVQSQTLTRHEIVLAADTTVDLAGAILGKPTDANDAAVMLRALSGRSHEVHTGVAVYGSFGLLSSVTTTTVTFRHLTHDDITSYVATGDPLDKAGSYGIQGDAGRFVTALSGSASNVVGLPMAQTAALLAAAGIDTIEWGPPRST